MTAGAQGIEDGGSVLVATSILRLFTWVAWADKHDGAIADVLTPWSVLAMHEAMGRGAVARLDSFSFLGQVSLVGPLLAVGNRVVAILSMRFPRRDVDFRGALGHRMCLQAHSGSPLGIVRC